MAKLKLDSDPDPDVFLIAISSHVNDYRLCWSLNNSLGIDLGRRKKDIEEELSLIHISEPTRPY